MMPTPASKHGMRANTARDVSECTNVKTSAKLEKGVRIGRDGTSSYQVFLTTSQRGPCIYTEKVSGESHGQPKADGGGHASKNRGVETYAYIHTTYILLNASRQRVSRSTILSKNVKSQKDWSNH